MTLQEIYLPIQDNIDGVKRELSQLADDFNFPLAEQIVRRFFQRPGKHLRPALLFFSANAILPQPSEELRLRLLQAALGLELIHNASLVHDDILDEDQDRRGQPTLNRAWGNKAALLIGDALYSRAFGSLTVALSRDLLIRVVKMNEAMCTAEIESLAGGARVRESYYRIIEGKTARFMSLCCVVGATLAGVAEKQIQTLESFGLNFGLAYQLFDDTVDQDLPADGIDGPGEALKTLDLARNQLNTLPRSSGRDSLTELCDYLQNSNLQPKEAI